MKIFLFTFVPFAIWGIGEMLWVGFLLPSARVLKQRTNNRTKNENIVKVLKSLMILGFRRVAYYRWKILFASISGIIVTDAYWYSLEITEANLSSNIYLLVLIWGSLILGTMFSLKGSKIMSTTPSSPLKSIHYLWGGFLNPFDQKEIKKIRETEKKVDKELMSQGSFGFNS